MAPSPRPFRIDAGLLGGTVHVDGHGDVEGLLDYELIGGTPERPTRLILHLPADGVVVGEGIVEVVRDHLSGDRVRALSAEKIRTEFAARSRGLSQSAAATYRDIVADMIDEAAGS